MPGKADPAQPGSSGIVGTVFPNLKDKLGQRQPARDAPDDQQNHIGDCDKNQEPAPLHPEQGAVKQAGQGQHPLDRDQIVPVAVLQLNEGRDCRDQTYAVQAENTRRLAQPAGQNQIGDRQKDTDIPKVSDHLPQRGFRNQIDKRDDHIQGVPEDTEARKDEDRIFKKKKKPSVC